MLDTAGANQTQISQHMDRLLQLERQRVDLLEAEQRTSPRFSHRFSARSIRRFRSRCAVALSRPCAPRLTTRLRRRRLVSNT